MKVATAAAGLTNFENRPNLLFISEGNESTSRLENRKAGERHSAFYLHLVQIIVRSIGFAEGL